MFENLKNISEKLSKDAIDKVKSHSDDLKQEINDKIQSYMLELNELLPAIREIGYEVNSIEIEIGVPPKIIPYFSKLENVSKETIQNVLNKYNDKKISTLILSSLAKANKMQKVISSDNLIFVGLSLEVGIVPTVRLKFIPSINQKLEIKK